MRDVTLRSELSLLDRCLYDCRSGCARRGLVGVSVGIEWRVWRTAGGPARFGLESFATPRCRSGIPRWIWTAGAGVVGQLRHSMNAFLADVGGHIGHGVRRSEGRKGIASTALGEVLAYVGDPVGLSRVLVTCDERNPVSRKTIEV